MIFVTGDTHGGSKGDMSKLNMKNFPIQKELTKEDYVVIAGDFGCVWGGRMKDNDKNWQDWLNGKSFTTLFVDGNHENFDLLETYPIEEWNGGKIRKISNSIYQLMRGQVFTIDGKKIFTMGGGVSVDKMYRKEGETWWKQEEPSHEEIMEGKLNLMKHNMEVDFVITHSAPKRFISELAVNKHNKCFECELDFFLDDIYDTLKFKQFLCGHYHYDKVVEKDFRVLFNDIVLLGGENGDSN